MVEVAKDYTMVLPSPAGIQQKMAAVKDSLSCIIPEQDTTFLMCKNVCCFTSLTFCVLVLILIKDGLFLWKYIE